VIFGKDTVEPGKPLGFLDANIRCGDSLLGLFTLKALEAGIPDAAYKPLSGDDKETAKHFEKRNKGERKGQGSLDFAAGGGRLPAALPMAGEAQALRAMSEDSPEEIAAKRKRFEAGRADPRRWSLRIAADLYIAAFLAPKTGGVPAKHNAVTIPTTGHVWDALAGRAVYGPLVSRAQELAGTARAFHWPLEFPDVMAAGGFDVVLGNPPWEVMQLNEEEYFAQHLPEIAELPGARRKKAIAALEKKNPSVFSSYQTDKRRYEGSNEVARASEQFSLTAQGKLNTYALFAELFAKLASPRGRAAAILPTGIAINETTSAFFGSVVAAKRLIRLQAFDEIKNWFAGTKDNQSFCIFVVGDASEHPSFVFQIGSTDDLNDDRRWFQLAPEEIIRFNPNTKTAACVSFARRCRVGTSHLFSRASLPRRNKGSRRQSVARRLSAGVYST
jgi:Eco57I restriction-modification methylase